MGNSNSSKAKVKRKRHDSLRSSKVSQSESNSILKTKQNSISEDYILLNKRPLGVGISGSVILCQNKVSKKKYALKKLKDSRNARREIELQWRASQNCFHVVRIKDVYENKLHNENYLLVVLEYMEGGELFQMIKKRTIPFTEQEVAKIMKQIIAAIKHLHSMGIAHRDLKPENLLLLTKDEQNFLIKLADFGFAKEAYKGLQTPNYTPYYVAPEILRFEKYDISCDIWSLGVIMYILCCGYPPFFSENGKRISPGMEQKIKSGDYSFSQKEWLNVSEEAKMLIRGMLETIPEKRMTIDDVLKSKWLSNNSIAPQIKLSSLDVLRESDKNYNEMLESVGLALNEMRIDYDKTIKMKNLTDINNPLYNRRKEKKKKLNQIIEDNENSTPKMNKKSEKNDSFRRGTSVPNRMTALYYSSNLNDENVYL